MEPLVALGLAAAAVTALWALGRHGADWRAETERARTDVAKAALTDPRFRMDLVRARVAMLLGGLVADENAAGVGPRRFGAHVSNCEALAVIDHPGEAHDGLYVEVHWGAYLGENTRDLTCYEEIWALRRDPRGEWVLARRYREDEAEAVRAAIARDRDAQQGTVRKL